MKRIIALAAALLMSASLFVGCGATAPTKNQAAYDTAPQEMPMPEGGLMDAAGSENAAVFRPQDDRKIIYNSSLSMESKQYDDALTALLAAAAEAGAYVQNSEEGGSAEWGSRWVRYTFRVPCDNYRSFMEGAGKAGNVTSKNESTQDVTAEYVDVEARLESLKAQETRLQELAEKAESLDDLLTIESHLSDVRYQIESYTGQKRVMDDLITYSTVEVYLDEVQTLTPVSQSFGNRLSRAFEGSWKGFVDGVQDFVIWFIYALPGLIVLAIVVTVVVLIVRRRRKHRAKKNGGLPVQTQPDEKQPAKYEQKQQ